MNFDFGPYKKNSLVFIPPKSEITVFNPYRHVTFIN